MVQQVDQRAVGPINGLQRPLHPGPVLGVVVGNLHIGVLQPGVNHEPAIHHQIREAVDRQHPQRRELNRGNDEGRQHHHQANVGAQHPAAEGRREEGPLQGNALLRHPEMGDRTAVGLTAGDTKQQIERPADDDVVEQGHQARHGATELAGQSFGE